MSLALGCIFFPISLTAQAFAPPGAEWCYQSYDVDGAPLGYVVSKYDRDSVVEGRSMKVFTLKVRSITPRGLRDVPDRGFDLLRQSGDSVFYYIPNIGIEVYLFKEHYQAGEETLSYLYNDPFDVLAVEEKIIDGALLSVAEINLIPRVERDLPVTMYGPWGPDRGFFDTWRLASEGHGRSYLEAYRADDVAEVKVVPRSQCFVLMDQPIDIRVTPAAPEPCQLMAFPNPVPMEIQWIRLRYNCASIRQGPYTLQLFDLAGRQIQTTKLYSEIPAAIPLGNLPGGHYFGVLTSAEEQLRFEFLKH